MRVATAVLALSAWLLPSTLPAQHEGDIVRTARAAGQFGTLLAAVDAAELTATLRGKGPFTVFAPTDAAFRALPPGTVESLLRPENRERLKALLLYHVVAGAVPARVARTLDEANTVEGRSVRIRSTSGRLRINDATVIQADVKASNGVVHVIDQVLMPPEMGAAGDRMEISRTGNGARDVVELAIRRAVPLFNAGQVEAAGAIYEVTAQALLAVGELPAGARRSLERGLRDADRDQAGRERAWTLRRALDEAVQQMDVRMSRMTGAH
ncbi:MAG: fasciclin domain-containing protein [Gemmatimonadales bacterium]|nr:fasciclin domain-containing protein [Gemmatimonadales bacterium]